MRSVCQQRLKSSDDNNREIVVSNDFIRCGAGQSDSRSGYTLFEMMLVLGLIAVFLSMTIPSVMRVFAQEKLSAAAEKIRAGLATARTRAIESGLIYQFCSEANGVHFVVAPLEPDHLNVTGANATGTTGTNATATANRLGRYSGNLPKGMAVNSAAGTPAAGAATTTPGYKVSAVSLDGLPNAGDLAGLNWSIPILFNADGSANMDREIIVSDSHAQRIRIHVRAFTGAAALGRIYVEKR